MANNKIQRFEPHLFVDDSEQEYIRMPVANNKLQRFELDLFVDDSELQKLAIMGLGMGVDCVSHTYDLLDLQLDPRQSPVQQLKVGCGYSAFKVDIQDWYKINSAMHAGIKSPTGFPVRVDVGINAARVKESRRLFMCEGEKVHTRTFRLVIEVPTEMDASTMDRSPYERNEQNSDLADGDDGDEPEAIGPELKRTPSHPPSVLRVETTTSRLDTLLSNKTQPDEPNAEENMIEICKSIIREENRGATHFISSIDLGAKVFYNETVSQKGQRSTVSANAGLDIASQAGGSAEMSRTDQSTGRSLRSDTTATIHPAVVWKKTQTAIEPEQEMVIGCEVSPVWLLVTNKDWRQAMKHACTQYVREHMHTAEHSFPVIATGGPFNISSGDYFLKVREDPLKGFTLEGTDQCQDASDLYIEVPRPTNVSEKSHDPLQNPDFGFYIYHAKDKRRGIKLYLCSDPHDESTVRLVTRIPSPNAYSRLYVEFPSTQALAPVSRWSKESMHLLRKTAYRKRRQYIVMKRTETRNEVKRTETRNEGMVLSSEHDDNLHSWEDTRNESMKLFFISEHDALDLQSQCQFTIRNASDKCSVDSKGNKKTCHY